MPEEPDEDVGCCLKKCKQKSPMLYRGILIVICGLGLSLLVFFMYSATKSGLKH